MMWAQISRNFAFFCLEKEIEIKQYKNNLWMRWHLKQKKKFNFNSCPVLQIYSKLSNKELINILKRCQKVILLWLEINNYKLPRQMLAISIVSCFCIKINSLTLSHHHSRVNVINLFINAMTSARHLQTKIAL